MTAPSISPSRSMISPPRAPSTAGSSAAREGRSSRPWIDFDLFGHQIVAHLAPAKSVAGESEVDGHDVPVPHFGVVLTMADWQALAERVAAAGTTLRYRAACPFQGPGRASRRRCSFAIPAATRWSSRRSPTTRCCSPPEDQPDESEPITVDIPHKLGRDARACADRRRHRQARRTCFPAAAR